MAAAVAGAVVVSDPVDDPDNLGGGMLMTTFNDELHASDTGVAAAIIIPR
jgi:hypothetical protein